MTITLNTLSDRPGAKTRRKRVGRGPGSGKGKTCGRGMNGQKSRSGVALGGFEGGQMPLYQRLPQRAFRNPFRKKHAIVNLGALQEFIDKGRIDPSAPVDEAALASAGLVGGRNNGVKVLADGEFNAKIELRVAAVSKSAAAAVEAAGGTVGGGDAS